MVWVLFLLLACPQTIGASWVCSSRDASYFWHTYVKHEVTCPSGAGCLSSETADPARWWTNVGFEKAGWSPIFGQGQLRDDSETPCNSASSIKETAGTNNPCGREMISILESKGWNSAIYNLWSGAFNCALEDSACRPHGGLRGNVCWDFTCAAQCQAALSCAPPKFDVVPDLTGWTCALETYADGNVCDCGCGLWDPDCDDEARVSNCNATSVCLHDTNGSSCFPRSAALADRKDLYRLTHNVSIFDSKHQPVHGYYSRLLRAQIVPSTWTCPAAYYNADDGCDCNCGAWDLDCNSGTQMVTNCPMDMVGPRVCDRKALNCRTPE